MGGFYIFVRRATGWCVAAAPGSAVRPGCVCLMAFEMNQPISLITFDFRCVSVCGSPPSQQPSPLPGKVLHTHVHIYIVGLIHR